ncbi:MAG: cardiolipin synthase [Clostridiales bacterium]|nr:cardiolipin synthase [Clostridiales bacterium]
MDKITKLFRSRYFLAGLAIILEFAQLLAVFILLYKYFLPITIMGWIFHISVLLYLLNRDEIPEFKLPWLIILFLLPVIGAFVFMLLSSNETSKKQFQRYEKASLELKPYQQQTEQIHWLREQDAEAFVQANYLYHAAAMPCQGAVSVVYYSLGEDFWSSLLADLRKAKRFILMEYFIVQEGQMWNAIHEILREKASRDVAVYFMYDDFGCMATLSEHYFEHLCEEGIHCIPSNKFTPVLSHIHNNRDHRKITVIDGAVGYTGGVNLADEYINAYEKHGHWKDTAVRLEGEAVRNLTMLFLAMWNTQSEQPMNCADYMETAAPKTSGKGIVIPFGDGPAPIYKDTIGKNVYLNMINGAKDYLYITTPYLICDHEILSALRLASQKGVDVRIITPHIPDKKTILLMTRSNYQVLLRDGVKIYEYTPGFIHAKNFVCDNKYAVCGTINLDYRSLVRHFECGAWMYDVDCIQEMKADFLETMHRSQQIRLDVAQLKGWKRLLAELMKVFSPLL